MRALASYVMRGPWQALLVASATALVSLIPLLGFASLFSGAVVALVALRQGFKASLMVVSGAALVMGIFSLVVVGNVGLGLTLLYVIMVWGPLLGLALILRNTTSWPMALDVAALFGMALVLVIYLLTGNPAAVWERLLSAAVASQDTGQDLSLFREQIPVVAQWITGVLGAALVGGMVASLLLARWWQSLLYNPGGFQQEFHGLRQSRTTSVMVLVILALSYAGFGMISTFATDVVVIVLVIYGVCGLGLLHALVAASGRGSIGLVVVYVLAFVALPYVIKALAALGFVDSWVNLRSWLHRSKSGTDKPHDN